MFEFISKYYVQVLTFVHGRIKKKKSQKSEKTRIVKNDIHFLLNLLSQEENKRKRTIKRTIKRTFLESVYALGLHRW